MSEIKILGTSHIAGESVKEVKRLIGEFKPDIVAVELDHGRLMGLLQKEEEEKQAKLGKKKAKQRPSFYAIRKVGFKGFMFAAIASWASQKLGRLIGTEPGVEMLTAVKLAKKSNLKVALIDQDIRITLQRFSKKLSWRERWNFLADIFNSIFFRKREMKKLGLGEIDLNKVPSNEMIKKLVGRMKERYPNVYKVLVDERNKVMASNLIRIARAEPDKKILAVVGAGHEDGLVEIMTGRKFDVPGVN
jgi:pheromone shutdown-related protein TraB